MTAWLPTGRLVGALVVGLLAGAATWYLGASPWYGAAVGAVAAALLVVLRTPSELEAVVWPPGDGPVSPGGRDELLLLGWAVTPRRGRVRLQAVQRLRAIARPRLEHHRLDLDAAADRDAIVALIGERAYTVLHSNVNSAPSEAAFLRCLDALDALTPKEPR